MFYVFTTQLPIHDIVLVATKKMVDIVNIVNIVDIVEDAVGVNLFK